MEQIDSSSTKLAGKTNNIFVYGTLRPDNEWLEAWAVKEISSVLK